MATVCLSVCQRALLLSYFSVTRLAIDPDPPLTLSDRQEGGLIQTRPFTDIDPDSRVVCQLQPRRCHRWPDLSPEAELGGIDLGWG